MYKQFLPTSNGFSIVEVMATLLVAGIFFQAFYTLFNVVSVGNNAARLQATASDYAYYTLRQYDSQNSGGNLTPLCGALNDGVTGSTIKSAGANAMFPLPAPVTLTVKEYRPQGCTADPSNPMKLEATVSYSLNGKIVSVTHAIYEYVPGS